MDQLLVVSWAPTPSQWARLNQPTLIIKGDRTAASWYRECAARMMELLPNGEMVTLQGQNHSAPWRATELVARTTIEFIDRVVASEPEDSPTM